MGYVALCGALRYFWIWCAMPLSLLLHPRKKSVWVMTGRLNLTFFTIWYFIMKQNDDKNMGTERVGSFLRSALRFNWLISQLSTQIQDIRFGTLPCRGRILENSNAELSGNHLQGVTHYCVDHYLIRNCINKSGFLNGNVNFLNIHHHVFQGVAAQWQFQNNSYII